MTERVKQTLFGTVTTIVSVTVPQKCVFPKTHLRLVRRSQRLFQCLTRSLLTTTGTIDVLSYVR